MNSDNPIYESKDDLLNRKSFSEHLADALSKSKEKEKEEEKKESLLNKKNKFLISVKNMVYFIFFNVLCIKKLYFSAKNLIKKLYSTKRKEEKEENLVIALCGKWGSGKSSIINLTKEHIKNNKDVKNKPIIIDFNPWYFSGLNNLIHYFFDEIAEKLGSLKTDKQLRKIAKNLKRYEVILSNKPVIDLIKDILYIFSTILSFCGIKFTECSWRWLWSGSGAFVTLSLILFAIAFYRSVKSYRLQQHSLIKSSIDDLKEKISNDLKKINNKLIIVIDDIDRLTKTEIRQLFQLIKINADFPNVIYLLAFDREIVENNLTVQDGFSGKDYLEKIVQVFLISLM